MINFAEGNKDPFHNREQADIQEEYDRLTQEWINLGSKLLDVAIEQTRLTEKLESDISDEEKEEILKQKKQLDVTRGALDFERQKIYLKLEAMKDHL